MLERMDARNSRIFDENGQLKSQGTAVGVSGAMGPSGNTLAVGMSVRAVCAPDVLPFSPAL